jgi:hypothetical protein
MMTIRNKAPFRIVKSYIILFIIMGIISHSHFLKNNIISFIIFEIISHSHFAIFIIFMIKIISCSQMMTTRID